MRLIDADALLKKVEQEQIQADIHGREFSTCFMNQGGTPSTEWWYVEDLIENAPTLEPEWKWETCFDCPLVHGCPKIRGCTNEQAEKYASDIPDDCPLSIEPERKKGRLIHESAYNWYRCSVCKKVYSEALLQNFNECMYQPCFRYCPNCGERLEEGGAE